MQRLLVEHLQDWQGIASNVALGNSVILVSSVAPMEELGMVKDQVFDPFSAELIEAYAVLGLWLVCPNHHRRHHPFDLDVDFWLVDGDAQEASLLESICVLAPIRHLSVLL